jgi:hypothetical protein
VDSSLSLWTGEVPASVKLAFQPLSTYPQSGLSTAKSQLTSVFAESIHSVMHRTLALHPRGWRDRSVLSCWSWDLSTVNLPTVVAVIVAVSLTRVSDSGSETGAVSRP